jgi:multisubunit Na+/H+ antiporter MnhF subunit
MTVWLVALLALVPPLLVSAGMAWRGRAGQRFIGFQLAGAVAVLMMVTMSFAFDQASSIDLAVAMGVLSLPAALLYAVFLERWL